MSIDTVSRNNIIKQLGKIISDKNAKEIELSIFLFSNEYAETNQTPYLVQSIYETKSDEIISLLGNKTSEYLRTAIKENKIDK